MPHTICGRQLSIRVSYYYSYLVVDSCLQCCFISISVGIDIPTIFGSQSRRGCTGVVPSKDGGKASRVMKKGEGGIKDITGYLSKSSDASFYTRYGPEYPVSGLISTRAT